MTSILLEKNVPCTVRNGTTLYADIYRPDQEADIPIGVLYKRADSDAIHLFI
ncbi:hypothetical protein JNUCC74_17965 [Cerasibacillus sp. JNUCC 74]